MFYRVRKVISGFEELYTFWNSIQTGSLVGAESSVRNLLLISKGFFYVVYDDNVIVGCIFFQFIEKCNNLTEMFMYSNSNIDFDRVPRYLFDDVDNGNVDVFMMIFDLDANADKMKKLGFYECGRIKIHNDNYDLIVLQRFREGHNIILR